MNTPDRPAPGDGHHYQVVTSYATVCGCGEPEHSQSHAHRFYSPKYDTTLPCACGLPVTSHLHACRDCGAQVGQPHDHGCCVERCQFTGLQWIACGGTSDFRCCCEDDNGYDTDGETIHSCGQVPHDCGSGIWTGVWPGYAEAIEFGWFTTRPGHFDAVPDLTRVIQLCDWDREQRRWVRR